MFYPEEEINENFICPYCKQLFDCPIVLPCEDTICKHHITDLLATLPFNVQSFECPLCLENHEMPRNCLFVENKVLSKMMRKKPVEVIQSALVEDFKKKLNESKLEADELQQMLLNNGNDFVYNYCQKLRTDVSLAIEYKIEEIHNISDAWISKIDQFETERINYLGN